MPKVKSFRSVGKQQAYDLEVDHPDHQFYLANGLLTSNSHAVSYAIDSYMCAWLLTYYEPEWLCAYVESQSGQPESRAAAISELRGFGYGIAKVDINHASTKWTIIDETKQFMPSLLSVKAVGEAAIDEIERFRPYKDLYDLLWNDDGSWKHSKFNKRALENLIKINAFDSMGIVGKGKTFSSYKQMHAVIIEGMDKLKHKKKGRDELKERLSTTAGMEEWTKTERIEMSKELVGAADMDLMISQRLRDRLEEKGLKSIDEFTTPNIYWFILDGCEAKMTRMGKPYLMLNAMGPYGKRHRIFCWSWKPQSGMPERNIPYLAELTSSDFGFGTFYFKMRSLKERVQVSEESLPE